MNRLLGGDEAARPPGVIDTLTAGYETINRRLWLLLLPVGLDLLFWLGPKLSIVRLAGYLPANTVSPEQPAAMTELLAHFNLAVLLALYVPTALGGRAPLGPAGAEISQPIPRAVYPLAPETFALAVAIMLPLAQLVDGLYIGGIGPAVRAV